MSPDSSHSHLAAGRESRIPAHAPHRRRPHDSALPRLATIATALTLASIVIVLAAMGYGTTFPPGARVAAYFVS